MKDVSVCACGHEACDCQEGCDCEELKDDEDTCACGSNLPASECCE